MMKNGNFASPFYSPDALAVTARHFPFIKSKIGEDVLPIVNGRHYFLFKTIELVGNQYADYRTIVNAEYDLKRILALHEEKKRFIVELGSICEHDRSQGEIEGWIASNNLISHRKILPRAPYLNINCSWDEFRAKKKRKFWYNISRSQKLLEEKNGGLSFKIINNSVEIPEVLDRCMLLYKENWNKLTSSSLFITEKGKAFLNDLLSSLAKNNNVEICILEQNKNLLVFSIGFIVDSTYFFYIFATSKEDVYSTYSIGKIHIKHLLESVFNRGFKKFDFMAGEEPYKYEWTKDSQARTTYYVMSKNVVNTCIMLAFWSFDMLVTYLKRQKLIRNILRRVSLF